MYPIIKRYQVLLEATGVNPGSSADVPFNCDDVSTQLLVRVYSLDPAQALGTGTAQVYRNGTALGSATAFAGTMITVAADPFAFAGANSELVGLFPPTVNSAKSDGYIRLSGGAMVMDQSSQIPPTPPLPMFVRVTNGNASKLAIAVVWTGLIWRP
jgi:hypothetical protein